MSLPSCELVILRRLGRGGFADVFLAERHGAGGVVRLVALKVLHAERCLLDEVIARLRDEAHLLGQLHHANIVQVLDLTTHQGRPAIVMEYIHGLDTGRLMALGPMPPRAALEAAAAAADALHAAYTHVGPVTGEPLRVVHRDIKPENILVSVDAVVKVLDFGVARADIQREAVTRDLRFGTQRYMGPERFLEDHDGPEGDVYALTVTLLEWLIGAPCGKGALTPTRLARFADEQLSRIDTSGWPEGWRAHLFDLLRAGLAFDPEDRPGADQLRDMLHNLACDAPGEGLRHFAHRRLRPLLLTRPSTSMLGLPTSEPRTIGLPAPSEPEPARVAVDASGRDDITTQVFRVSQAAPTVCLDADEAAEVTLEEPAQGIRAAETRPAEGASGRRSWKVAAAGLLVFALSALAQGKPASGPLTEGVREASPALSVPPAPQPRPTTLLEPHGPPSPTPITEEQAPLPSEPPIRAASPPTDTRRPVAAPPPLEPTEVRAELLRPRARFGLSEFKPPQPQPLDGPRAAAHVSAEGQACSFEVDGQSLGAIRERAAPIEVPLGSRMVTTRCPWTRTDRTLTFYAEEDIQYRWLSERGAWLLTLPAAEATRSHRVSVQALDGGGALSVDGRPLGSLPMLVDLPRGRHELRVSSVHGEDTLSLRVREDLALAWRSTSATLIELAPLEEAP